MRADKREALVMPSAEQLRAELKHERYKAKYRTTLTTTVFILVIVAAFSVLVAMLWVPVLEIYGESMTPTLEEKDVVIALNGKGIQYGDLVAFYYGNKLLVKRCIALPGDILDITEDGTVSVNGKTLIEPYVSDKAKGSCDIEFPYSVPQERYFLMGDHRATSVDSRSNVIGCVSSEQIVGRVVFCVWPLNKIGKIGGA